MNKFPKSVLIYLVIAVPIMLLTKLAFNEGSLTIREAVITLAETLLNVMIITAVVNWIGKQQPKKHKTKFY